MVPTCTNIGTMGTIGSVPTSWYITKITMVDRTYNIHSDPEATPSPRTAGRRTGTWSATRGRRTAPSRNTRRRRPWRRRSAAQGDGTVDPGMIGWVREVPRLEAFWRFSLVITIYMNLYAYLVVRDWSILGIHTGAKEPDSEFPKMMMTPFVSEKKCRVGIEH